MHTLQARLLGLGLALSLIACSTTSDSYSVVDADPEVRAPLLGAVAALEGTWTGQAPDGSTGVTTFEVIASGSAVRETMMPGTPMEMVNMYTLDGNALVMTHYCAGGNQPHMRATSIEDGRIVFEPTGVSDLKAEDEVYMGSMTIVIQDADTIEQRWTSYQAGVRTGDHDMTIPLSRER